ncbi:hypothetical protein glysoja_043177 [Glycine soja]|uniref:Uncharacterized protein n=1 Tax=Glycine soja TaxID=3848 RepID=A0A0B2SMP4_GLYSO|nr:hypothetical protein glysoja_043177 [Glycine soja]
MTHFIFIHPSFLPDLIPDGGGSGTYSPWQGTRSAWTGPKRTLSGPPSPTASSCALSASASTAASEQEQVDWGF